MNSPIHELLKNSSFTIKLLAVSALLLTTSASVADETNTAYVDSVHKWGAWELDIEPAAGGLSQPTMQALNARNTKVTLRTNSFAALAPPAVPGTPEVPGIPVVPVPPIVPPPVIPTPVPTITPINSNVPIPVGGPGGGPAPTPTITTINPNVPIPVGGPGVPTGGPGA